MLGTTDTLRSEIEVEPRPLAEEVRFILGEAAQYLARPPLADDVRSAWEGLRPLVRPTRDSDITNKVNRVQTVVASAGGLVTVTGGKWTTYRAMAEDVLAKCMDIGALTRLPPCETAEFSFVGAPSDISHATDLTQAPGLHAYGTEAEWVAGLPGADKELAHGLTEAMIRFAARYEYACTVEDVLARRSRLLFLDARLAAEVAPRAADIMRAETGLDPKLDDFLALCEQYLQLPI